jgi:hypothetical protein
MLSRNTIITDLAGHAPHLHLSTTWEEDPTFTWDGDGPDPATSGFYAHDVTVAVRRIEQGQILEAESHLGGSYSQFGGPHCPDIHGYFPQMAEEALEELGEAGAAKRIRQLIHADYEHSNP